MPTSSRGARLNVLVLNASPTHKAFFAALSGHEGSISNGIYHLSANEATEYEPQVVLVDVENQETPRNADELLRKALNTYPNAATVLLSDNPSSPIIKDLMRRHPLNGCVISSQKVDSIASTLLLASQGMAVLPTKVLDQLRRGRPQKAVGATTRSRGNVAGPRFTGRQYEVCQLLMEGLSNKAIAYRLGITENTVKNHVRSIMTRLRVISRTQLVLALLGSR
jgi:DNA-binding NarL/FixJ family response regulator